MDALFDIRPLLQSWPVIQSWAARFFLFLGVLTLFPWILLVLFDAGMYVWRYLILAPITRFLYPNIYVLAEDEDEDEEEVDVVTATMEADRSKALDMGTGDGLGNSWKKKDV